MSAVESFLITLLSVLVCTFVVLLIVGVLYFWGEYGQMALVGVVVFLATWAGVHAVVNTDGSGY